MTAPTTQQGADPGQPAAGLDNRELERIRSGLAQVLHDDGSAHVPQAFKDMALLLAEVDRLSAALSSPSQGPAARDAFFKAVQWAREDPQATADRLWDDYCAPELNCHGMPGDAPTVKESLTVPPVPAAPATPRKLEWGLSERQDAVNILRHVCEDFGDNDWPDDLHLGDVIEKHLWRNLLTAHSGSAAAEDKDAG